MKFPYPQRVIKKLYPKEYISPKFIKFNGKQGRAEEYLHKFVKTLNVYELDDDLKFKEFSKSLMEKVYT